MRNIIKRCVYIAFAMMVLGVCIPANATEKKNSNAEELRGVWIGTIHHIDYPYEPTKDAKALKQEIVEEVTNCKNLGFNAIFLQVRPNSDAIYPSAIFPWSSYLTGKQGEAPLNNFDPLQCFIKNAHANGIQVHAWINPYRITSNGVEEWNQLSPHNPAKMHPEWVIQYKNGNFYYNPALPEVRNLIEQGIIEILQNYDVDGIHMDDYFYPGKDFQDEIYYNQLNQGQFTNIADWRRNNVNILIQEINQIVHSMKPSAKWGISPSGVWENKDANPLGSLTNGGNPSYSKLYADTRLWAISGWVDYIAPQIYWNIGHDKADYQVLLKWWSDTLKNAPASLYIGIADYKAYRVGENSIWYGGNEIQRQIEMNRKDKKVGGEIHFRYQNIVNDPILKEVIIRNYRG